MKKKVKRVARKSKPTSITVVSPVDPEVQVMVASELQDDNMIEQGILGQALPHFVYKFSKDGKDVVGLTVKGVNEVVRRLNVNSKSGSKIRINPKYLLKEEKEYNGQKGIEVSVFAEDLVSGNSGWGIKFEPYYKEGRSGKSINTFAIEKALAKAERNAKRKLISETIAVKLIEKMMKENPAVVKQLEAPRAEYVNVTPSAPKASTPEELCALAIRAIEREKSAQVVISIDEGAQKSVKLGKEQKDKIHVAASARVDAIEGNIQR